MSNTKHTPGPWHVTDWPGDWSGMDGVSIGIDDDFGADGGRNHYLVTVINGDPDELKANAHLVAASPELLQAARAALKLLESVAFVTKEGDTDKPLRLLRAAIAKAQGGAA